MLQLLLTGLTYPYLPWHHPGDGSSHVVSLPPCISVIIKRDEKDRRPLNLFRGESSRINLISAGIANCMSSPLRRLPYMWMARLLQEAPGPI